MMNAAILSLLLLCTVIHRGDCLPRKHNDVKIKTEVASLLHRLAKTNNYEHLLKKDSGIPMPTDKRTPNIGPGTHNISCGAQPVELTASSGVIKSPGYYHGSYPNNAFCQWRIAASTGNVISVTFQQLSLEAHPQANCPYDSVTLYDGSSANSTQLGKYCTDIPATITSSGSSLFVVFKSDYSINSGRFSLRWTFVSQGGGGQASCGKRMIEPISSRIVGGSVALPHSWPWQCKVGGCGATVIGDRYILTAAHCVYRKKAITVTCGVHDTKNYSDPAIQRFTGVSSVVHENYNKAAFLDSDIAILRLPTPLTFNDYVQPVCLPSSPVAAGTNCTITGWGRTQNTGSNNVLRQAVVPTLSLQDCRARWGQHAVITSNMLCASTASGKGICSGDSGGPLVCKQGDTWLQYGIANGANTKNCVHPDKPGVFANVVNFLPWIQNVTGIGPSARTA